MTEHVPEFLGHVRGIGREQQHKRFHHLLRPDFDLLVR